MSDVNNNIRNYRIFRGFSQKKLGEMLNKSANVISNWETGTHSPDIDTVEQICKALAVTPNELYGWETNKDYENWMLTQDALKAEIEELEKQRNDLDSQIFEAYHNLQRLKHDNVAGEQ